MFRTSQSRIVVAIILAVIAFTLLSGIGGFYIGVRMGDGTVLHGWVAAFLVIGIVWATIAVAAGLLGGVIALLNWIDKGE
jgi:Na+/melibiose symporter-like transporter